MKYNQQKNAKFDKKLHFYLVSGNFPYYKQIMDIQARLRTQIRAGRELLDMKQSDLAEMLGFSLSKISRAESGETKSGDTLLEIKQGLERCGVEFLPNGVVKREDVVFFYDGPDFYLRALDEAHKRLLKLPEKERELLFLLSDDSVSPQAVVEKHRVMRADGIRMRKLICEGNRYLLGPRNEYRYIPVKYFTNLVSLVFANCTAQVNGAFNRVFIREDAGAAQGMRALFETMWDILPSPEESTADVRY